MRRRGWLLAALTLTVLVAVALTGCAKAQTAVDTAKEKVKTQTEQKQAAVDQALNSAQDTVGQLAAAVGGLEARISGLQINSDLQEIQRKLTAAIQDVGDKKVAALNELSTAFNNVIGKVETAAGKLPAGGVLQTELNDFAAKLKSTQASLAAAAASYEASSTTSP